MVAWPLQCSHKDVLSSCYGIAMELLGCSMWLPGCCHAVSRKGILSGCQAIPMQLQRYSRWLSGGFYAAIKMF